MRRWWPQLVAVVVAVAVACAIVAATDNDDPASPQTFALHHSGPLGSGTGGGLLTAATAPKMAKSQVVQGTALTLESGGTWTSEATSRTYQWQDCKVSAPNALVEPSCGNITGATSATYTPKAGDAGYSIRAVVTGHRGSAVGVQHTGYTVGAEPKYGNLYPAGSYWRQKLPASGTERITEHARYEEGIEQAWEHQTPQLTTEANTAAMYWAPPGQPTASSAITSGSILYKAELNSVMEAIPMAPWMVGAKAEPSTSGEGDKHLAIFQGNAEWDMFNARPEVLDQPTEATCTKAEEEATTCAANASKKFHLTGSEAKGYVTGARMEFVRIQSGVTKPKSAGFIYYVVSPEANAFQVSETPGGAPISVEGHKYETSICEPGPKCLFGLLNDTRKWGFAEALSDRSIFTGGHPENGEAGTATPTAGTKDEMWRWGTETGGQPRGAGIITYEDMRKVQAGGKIEHALASAIESRKARMLGPASRGFCSPGSCWSANLKSDGATTKAQLESKSATYPCLAKGAGSNCFFPMEGETYRLAESTDCKHYVPGTLTTAAKTSEEPTGLKVSALKATVASGTTIKTNDGTHAVEEWVTSATAAAGATEIKVTKRKPAAEQSIGAKVEVPIAKVTEAICTALVEYGAHVTDNTSQFQFYGQEGETLGDATAFLVYNPWKEGPNFGESKSALAIGKELTQMASGKVEVMTATEYCESESTTIILKAIEGKLAAKAEEASGCKRPTEIE